MPIVPEPTSLIVAERGSDWTRWVDVLRAETPGCDVIVQQPGESVGALSQRVRAHVASLVDGGGTLRNAVIVGGGRTDADAISARSQAVRAIVAPMVKAAGGRLFLSAGSPDRLAMMGLAGVVAPMLVGTGVTVLPVGDPPPMAAVA